MLLTPAAAAAAAAASYLEPHPQDLGGDGSESTIQPTTGKCAVCMDDGVQVYSNLCGTGCEGGCCLDCLNVHFTVQINDSRYSAAPMRCPLCRERVPMYAWCPFVPKAAVRRYNAFPRALLSLRCPSCDEVTDLMPSPAADCLGRFRDGEDASVRYESPSDVSRETCHVKISELISKAQVDELTSIWNQFAANSMSTHECIEAMLRAVPPGSEDEHYQTLQQCLDKVDGVPPEPLGQVMSFVLRLVVDVERRAALQLAWLRRFPMTMCPCWCEQRVCFKCKVEGWHALDGQTCAERQKAEMNIEAQYCPACGVATVRSEGCSHIICVCGCNWTWEGSDY